MSVNEFRPRKYEDFEIVDENGVVVGHVRVKPSGVLWAPKGAHVWHGLTIKKFGDLAIGHGTRQKK
mgnify:CR=1 FL=1